MRKPHAFTGLLLASLAAPALSLETLPPETLPPETQLPATRPPAARAGATVAGQTLPEILVTAQFRKPALQQSSTSVAVLDQSTIQQRAARHLEELLNAAANVNFAGGGSRARYFQIRGVGDRSQFQEPLNPSVGVLLDGVDFSGLGTIGTLFDVAQVEILRGPQGTLHGANALAGLINIRSAAPTEDFYQRLQADAGNYSSYGAGLVNSGPLGATLRYRLAAQQLRSDGYQQNNFLQRDDTAGRDEQTLRARLRWFATDSHTLDLTINRIDVDNGYDGFSLDNNRHTRSDEPGQDSQLSRAIALRSSAGLAPFDLHTTLSYAVSDSAYGYDEDWTYNGFHPDAYSATDLYTRQRDSISAEIRLLSNDASRLWGGRGDWVAGLYYLANDENLDRRYTYHATDFNSAYDTASAAVFTRLNTALSARLTLITGLRLEHRATTYRDNSGVRFAPDATLWGGRIALQYQIGDTGLVYGSLARGYRANGVNAGILASIDAATAPAIRRDLHRARQFDAETLLNYEAGLKTSLRADSLRLRLALFYMRRDKQQLRGSFMLRRDSGATTFVDYTDNADAGKNVGAEMAVDWLADERLQLWVRLGLLATEFEDYVYRTEDSSLDLSGRDQAHAPAYQYSLGGRLGRAGNFYLRLELEGRDAFYFSDRHNSRSRAYHLLNASLNYRRQRWSLSLWGRNLTDSDYYTRGFLFGNDPRKGFLVEPYYQFAAPRLVGVTASYAFYKRPE